MLPRSSHRPIRALAGALFDRGSGIPEDRLQWLLADLGDFAGHAGPKTRTFFLITLYLLEWLPPFFGHFSRMSRLPIDRRLDYLERLDRSALTALIALPKAMISLVYYEHPDALLETGYDHQPLMLAAPEGARADH